MSRKKSPKNPISSARAAFLLPETDRQVLSDYLQIDRLDPNHPIQQLLSASEAYSVRELRCLADDLRVVEHVDGSKSLFRSLRKDKDNYPNFRFELRLAASIGRVNDQTLLRLAGPLAGPDILFKSKSGHTCGIACYRVSPEAIRLVEAQQSVERIVTPFFRRCASPIEKDVLVQLTIPSFPITPEVEAVAISLLRDFWLMTDVASADREGFTVERFDLPFPTERSSSIRRRVVARVLVPVKDFERERVLRHLTSKIPTEAESWATNFEGQPIFAVEESDSVHGGQLKPHLIDQMADEGNIFAGVLLMHYPPCGPQQINFLAKQGKSLGINIGIESFYESIQTLSKEQLVMSVTPAHAKEEWLFEQGEHGYQIRRVRPLSIGSKHVVVPELRGTMKDVAKHPKLHELLEAAVGRLNREENAPSI